MEKNKTRALVLMSGGLDSILAAKILQVQGINVALICFESVFFSSTAASEGASKLGLPLRVIDISRELIKAMKQPDHGFGAAVNPCIDCHLLMLKTAKKIMEAEGFDFVATGEVLGERPMSQNKLSLDIIERESGLAGYLLRPLSAKLLPATVVEAKGLVDRNKLYGISGRSRKIQLALAEEFGIKEIPQPAGGCVLTEIEFGKKMKKLMAVKPDFNSSDALVLRHGRTIWEDGLLLAVARDQKECAALKNLAKTGDWIFDPKNFPGPVVLARNFGSQFSRKDIVFFGKKYLLQYSKKIPKNPDISITETTTQT